jgi:hypothetical protein
MKVVLSLLVKKIDKYLRRFINYRTISLTFVKFQKKIYLYDYDTKNASKLFRAHENITRNFQK